MECPDLDYEFNPNTLLINPSPPPPMTVQWGPSQFSHIQEGVRENFLHIRGGGAMNFFTITEHFNPPPTVIVDSSLTSQNNPWFCWWPNHTVDQQQVSISQHMTRKSRVIAIIYDAGPYGLTWLIRLVQNITLKSHKFQIPYCRTHSSIVLKISILVIFQCYWCYKLFLVYSKMSHYLDEFNTGGSGVFFKFSPAKSWPPPPPPSLWGLYLFYSLI